MKTGRGCGTCRDRRVYCDRGVPTCQRCTLASRVCSGYSLRLSWPKNNRQRNTSFAPERPSDQPSQYLPHAEWLHTTSEDVRAHYEALAWGSNYQDEETIKHLPRERRLYRYRSTIKPVKQDRSPEWQSLYCISSPSASPQSFPTKDIHNYKGLLTYFATTASRSITIFGHSSKALCQVLIPMALSDPSPSAVAVLTAILSYAALHRDGLQVEALQLKARALSALAVSMKKGLKTQESALHVAAGMLLCCFEIQANTETSAQWLWYVCGAGSIINRDSMQEKIHHDHGLKLLQGWVQYYGALARFVLPYWTNKNSAEFKFGEKLGYHETMPAICARGQDTTPPSVPYQSLRMFTELGGTLHHLAQSTHSSYDFEQHIIIFELALDSAFRMDFTDKTPSASVESEDAVWQQLFHLAILVYSYRASGAPPSRFPKLVSCIDQAFEMIDKLRTLKYSFPLLILGLEAQADDRRLMLLKLMRTVNGTTLNKSLTSTMSLVLAGWVQQDLQQESRDSPHGLSYQQKLGMILNSAPFMPVLA